MTIPTRLLLSAVLLALLSAGCVQVKTVPRRSKPDNAPAPAGDIDTFTGRCHCGQVQYAASGPVEKTSTCDCIGCRKATGTFSAPFVTVQRSRFEVTAGEPKAYRGRSGKACDAHGVYYFCANCGTQVYWRGNRGETVDLFAGTLDDPTVYRAHAKD
jgi:hypothetical protein